MFMRMVYLAWSLPKRYPISFAAILLAGAGSLDYLVGYNVRLSAL